jgi:hypothetical protein
MWSGIDDDSLAKSSELSTIPVETDRQSGPVIPVWTPQPLNRARLLMVQITPQKTELEIHKLEDCGQGCTTDRRLFL